MVGGRGRQTPPALWKDCGWCRLGFVGETSSHEKTPVIPSFREKTSGIRQKKALTAPSGTRQRTLLLSFTTKKRRCVGILFRAILLPSRHKAFTLRLRPTFSGVHSQWRIFVHTAFAASVASLRSQCRPRGVLRLIPSKLPPDQIGLCSVQPHDFTGSYSIIIILSYGKINRLAKILLCGCVAFPISYQYKAAAFRCQ